MSNNKLASDSNQQLQNGDGNNHSDNQMINLPSDTDLDFFDYVQKDLRSSPTGGLLIMSQGTGIYKVIGQYLDSFDKGSQTIFFLINFDERDVLKSEVNEIQHYTKKHKIVDVSSMISTKRADLYNKGGVFSVSEVVLLFDLLSGSIVHAERITGFIINRIQTVRDPKETLVWLCTLLKTNNPASIILGISESSRGLENIMRWFYMPRCFVWNMIRAEVQNEENQCEFLDTFVDMNKRMKNIDNSIKVIIILILKELKARRNPHEAAEYPIFTQEEFMNSHQYILEDKIKSNKFYLRAFMNNIQYFKDAFDFKQLQRDLFQLNCVSFYKRLLGIEHNSNEDSFINKTVTDKSTQKAIKELFENAQKRVFEMQKQEETYEVKLKESQLFSDRGFMDSKVNLLSHNSNMIPAQDSNQQLISLKHLAGINELQDESDNNQITIKSSNDSNCNLDEQMNNSQMLSQQNSQDSLQSQGLADKKEDLTQQNSMNIVKESKQDEEEDDDEEIEQPSNQIEEEEQKVDRQSSLNNISKIIGEGEADQNVSNKKNYNSDNNNDDQEMDEKLKERIDFMRNIIEQDSNQFMENLMSGDIKQHMFQVDDQEDDGEDIIKYETNYKIKLNLDIDPKFRCLSVILNEINEKYKDQLPINGERFLIWIHTNDRSRVSSIQEYIQNAFLKNDPSNKISLMKRYRLFLGDQLQRRHTYIKEMIKSKKDQLLVDKKECEVVLLEQLFKELDYFFQIVELEQLDINREANNNAYQQFDEFTFSALKNQNSRNSKGSTQKNGGGIPNSGDEINKNDQGQQMIEEQIKDSEIPEEKRISNKIRRSDRVGVDELDNNILEVKKRKLVIDDKLNKKFKTIDINQMNLNIIDELDQTGHVQFLSKKIMANFEFIVNSTNRSVIRQHFLRTYRPNFIILFEPNLSIIREVSVMQHLIKQNGVNPVYEMRTIMFNKSAESEKTLYNSILENQATERIIKEKNQMACSIDEPTLRIKNITKKANTRVGGQLLAVQPTVIVDKREFRSDLPSILFHEGFKVIPIQLNTGDYILSKDIAVERKSVETPDLVNSLRNGRLYQQLTAMSKSYKKCYLLIEFSESMPFSLESINYNNENILNKNDNQNQNFPNKVAKTNTITFYLPLLVSQFENMRILWSKGPLHTSKIFQMLKQNQLEPNPSEFLKEQDKKEKKESTIDQYIQANQEDDKYKPAQSTLFDFINQNKDQE